MYLREIIDRISPEVDDMCIVAKRPWEPYSEARLVRLTEDFKIPGEDLDQGYEYFLEVSVALDAVLDGLDDILTKEQRFSAVLYYAENDAYPDWLCAIRDKANP
jgi:hypothetical protein